MQFCREYSNVFNHSYRWCLSTIYDGSIRTRLNESDGKIKIRLNLWWAVAMCYDGEQHHNTPHQIESFPYCYSLFTHKLLLLMYWTIHGNKNNVSSEFGRSANRATHQWREPWKNHIWEESKYRAERNFVTKPSRSVLNEFKHIYNVFLDFQEQTHSFFESSSSFGTWSSRLKSAFIITWDTHWFWTKADKPLWHQLSIV